MASEEGSMMAECTALATTFSAKKSKNGFTTIPMVLRLVATTSANYRIGLSDELIEQLNFADRSMNN